MYKSILLFLFINIVFFPSAKSDEIVTHQFDVHTNYGIVKFETHFLSKDSILAQRIEEVANKDLINVVNYFGHAPVDTVHINIDSKVRTANGNARNFPTNIINLYHFPSSNSEHLIVLEDWWKGLIIHEFTHIVHLDYTKGFWEKSRSIFGTVAKLPIGLVPRWMTEGIAVWSESTFYKNGRLQNELFNKELWLFLSNPKNCSRIDCIDEPGVYPFAQLSYWMGGQFMNYLENQKPNTVKCLIDENASNMPFFLNDVFERCTGKNAIIQFENFKSDFIKKYPPQVANENEIQKVKGPIFYQKGISLAGHKLFYVERNKYTESLIQRNFDTRNYSEFKFSHPISNVGQYLIKDNKEKILLAFNEDPNFKSANKVWKLIDLNNPKEMEVIPFEDDPSYVIALDQYNYLTFAFNKNHWNYKKIKYSNNEIKIEKSFEFDYSENLLGVSLYQNKIILKVLNTVTDEASLVMSDYSFLDPKVFYQSKNYFDWYGSTMKGIIIREKDQHWFFKLDTETVTKIQYNKDDLKDVTLLVENDEHRIQLKSELENIPALGHEVLGREEIVSLIKYQPKKIEVKKIDTRKYPELDHFKPHYWFFAVGSAENLTSLGAQTMFSDPEEIHSLSASTFYYNEIKKLGGNVSYNYDISPFVFEADFSNDYSKNSVNSSVINLNQTLDFNLKYVIEKNRFTLIPSAFSGIDVVEDYITHRTSKYVGVRGILEYKANTYVDSLQGVSLTSRFATDFPSNGESYLNFQNKLNVQFKIKDDMNLYLKAAMGKLFKSDFKRGVIYGGGDNSFRSSRWFDYYGLPYGNAYGNDISSARLKFDFNFLNFYKGHNLFPFYMKELHFVGGVEALKTDVIFVNDYLYRDESIHSVFLGLNAKTTMFYLAPINFEVIFSSINSPNGESVGSGSFIMNVEI